jgi:hypothetical protein
MDTGTLISAARDIGKYVLVAFSVYFVGILVHIILGIFSESVVPALGLNATGAAVTAVGTLITAVGVAITAITGIVTVVTGLMILVIVLKLFGFRLDFNMGGRV